MSCCCQKVYALCDTVVCDEQDLVLPFTVDADGEYTLELNFLEAVLRKTALLSSGDSPTFDKDGLNEAFTYVGRVLGPDGQPVSFTVDAVEYDCLQFTTKRCLTCTPTSSSSSS